MEIVVRGRHLTRDVGDSFRDHCHVKLERLGRLDHRLRRLDVELSHEHNPRQSGHCQRVEITVVSHGPVVRAEASARDCYAAFEGAFAKLEERLRRASSRRVASHSHSHHSHPQHAISGRVPVAPGDASSGGAPTLVSSPTLPGSTSSSEADAAGTDPPAGSWPEESTLETQARLHAAGLVELDGGLIVREKVYAPEPMDLDEAVHRMELVGHDFYLFSDAVSGIPSVVYRRRGYDYGVLRLAATLPRARDGRDGAPPGSHPLPGTALA